MQYVRVGVRVGGRVGVGGWHCGAVRYDGAYGDAVPEDALEEPVHEARTGILVEVLRRHLQFLYNPLVPPMCSTMIVVVARIDVTTMVHDVSPNNRHTRARESRLYTDWETWRPVGTFSIKCLKGGRASLRAGQQGEKVSGKAPAQPRAATWDLALAGGRRRRQQGAVKEEKV